MKLPEIGEKTCGNRHAVQHYPAGIVCSNVAA